MLSVTLAYSHFLFPSKKSDRFQGNKIYSFHLSLLWKVSQKWNFQENSFSDSLKVYYCKNKQQDRQYKSIIFT